MPGDRHPCMRKLPLARRPQSLYSSYLSPPPPANARCLLVLSDRGVTSPVGVVDDSDCVPCLLAPPVPLVLASHGLSTPRPLLASGGSPALHSWYVSQSLLRIGWQMVPRQPWPTCTSRAPDLMYMSSVMSLCGACGPDLGVVSKGPWCGGRELTASH